MNCKKQVEKFVPNLNAFDTKQDVCIPTNTKVEGNRLIVTVL